MLNAFIMFLALFLDICCYLLPSFSIDPSFHGIFFLFRFAYSTTDIALFLMENQRCNICDIATFRLRKHLLDSIRLKFSYKTVNYSAIDDHYFTITTMRMPTSYLPSKYLEVKMTYSRICN